ncbi:hypothetical protein LguiA_022267 [Lonicera macranthoides]
MHRNYIPIVLYFPNNACDSAQKIAEKSRQLKHSLSEALVQYYPFAGRLTCRAYIDCNDEGVEFQEAQIKFGLSEMLKKHEDTADLDFVFPRGLVWGRFANESSVMVVRFNYFDCGGIAVAVCLSHKIADGCTFASFLHYWAAVTLQSGEQVSPHFYSSPPNDSDIMQDFLPPKKNWVTRRFVFRNSKIAQLKTMVASSDGQSPTRVEFLAALLYKSATAVAKSCSGSFSPSMLVLPVNMRPNMVPQLPKTSAGNLFWQLYLPTTTETKLSLNSITDRIKKGKMKIKGMEVLDGKEFMSPICKAGENNYKIYFCSSICNLDLYKVDFGWGKPVKVALGDTPFNNSFIFMETPSGDGIEALVSLDEQEMLKFQVDEEIMALA